MAFPSSPTNGQQATVNGITYSYSSATRSWRRVTLSNVVADTGTFATKVTTGNLATGPINANGAVTVASIIANTTAVVTGNITGENIITSGLINATGNINSNSNITVGNAATFTTSNIAIQGWGYTGLSLSVSTQDTAPTDVFVGNNTNSFYVLGDTNNAIFQYNMSTAGNVATGTFFGSISIASQETSPRGMYFDSTGANLYMVGTVNRTVYQYALSTPWNITTATYATKSANVATQDSSPQGVWFSPNLAIMYVPGNTNDTVYQYTLSSAGNVSTATYASKSISVASQDTAPAAVQLSNDGTKMWLLGQGTNAIFQYNLGTAFDISTATTAFGSSFSTYMLGAETTPHGFYVDETNNRAYVTGAVTDTVYQLSTNNSALITASGIGTTQGLTIGGNAYVSGRLHVTTGSQFESSLIVGSTFTAASTATFSTTTGTISIGTSQTTGIINIGGTAQTGNITIGRSTANQTITIANGVTASGSVKYVDIGTLGASGSNTIITIGSVTAGAVTTTTVYGNTTFSNISAATINAATIGNAGAAFTGASISAATIGNSGAAITGATGIFTTKVTTSNLATGAINANGAVTVSSLASNGAVSGTTGTFGSGVVTTTLNTNANATVNGLTVNTTATIAGGIQNTPIGNVAANTGAFTTVTGTAGTFTTSVTTSSIASGPVNANANVTAAGLTVNASATVGTTLGVAGVTSITNTTDSTGTGNGALVVSGGAGIAKNLNVGGGLVVSGSATIGNLTVTGNTTIYGANNLAVSDNLIELHTDANLTTPTSDDGRDIGIRFHYWKTSANNAALIWNNNSQYLQWWSAGTGDTANTITQANSIFGTFQTGNIILTGTQPAGGTGGDGTRSTSISTGALVLNNNSGAGIGGNIYVGGNLVAGNATITTDVTAATSTFTTKVTTSNLATGAINANGAVTVSSLTSNGAISGTTGTFGSGVVTTTLNTNANATVNGLTVNTTATIAGGIQNTPIGNATANTGAFTTLTATGQTSLGGAAGAEALRAVVTVGSTARLQVTGGVVSGGSGTVEFAGISDASDVVNINYATGQIGNHAFKTGASKLTQFNITGVASSVNYLQVVGATTGNSPVLSAQGSDGNISLTLSAKGTGNVTTASPVYITNANASTSTSTGALVVTGGLGVNGNIYGTTIYGATVNAATIGNAGAVFTGASISAATIGNTSATHTGGTYTGTDATFTTKVTTSNLATGAINANGAVTVSSLTSNGAVTGTDITASGNLSTGNQKSVLFYDSDGSHYVAFKGPTTVTTNVTWTLPSSDGTSGQVISTDGLGTLSWSSAGSSTTGGYFNSTLNAFPGSTGNIDYGNGETYVGQAATVDAFGISVIAVFTCNDPVGSLQGPNDLGVLT